MFFSEYFKYDRGKQFTDVSKNLVSFDLDSLTNEQKDFFQAQPGHSTMLKLTNSVLHCKGNL